jgi:ubiquinone/menaquinone biosynthesis C-methylase UbiE
MKVIGDVSDLDVVDIGCGNGYLCRKLDAKNARVTGVEVSEEMLNIAKKRSKGGNIQYVVASATDLSPISGSSYDKIIYNHVFSSLENCQKALSEAYEVLRPDGHVYIMTSHPCFSCGDRCWHYDVEDTPRVEEASRYSVDNYFSNVTYMIDSWEGFTKIPYFHKTLGEYWSIIKESGFVIEDFGEPTISENDETMETLVFLNTMNRIPLSCCFTLSKSPGKC